MINDRLFIEERVGRLMRLEEHELSRYEFEIWFEYTRTAMAEVREGAMLAVANFSTVGEERHLSILEITSLKPVHYALGDNPDGYPAFVMEAARNASQDWVSQEDRSEEDTTIIRCTAIPTDLELVLRPDEDPEIASEGNIPMIGADARLLDSSLIGVVVNRNIDAETESTGAAGTLLRDSTVQVLVRVEDLLKVHFGIFGFTGAGKSNLVSTLISTVISELPESKVVLFDLMGEYGTLLIDRINELEDGLIVCLGDKSIPQPVFDYINENEPRPALDDAAQLLSRFFLLPKALLGSRDSLSVAFRRLLESRKIRVSSELRNIRVSELTQGDRNPWGRLGPQRRQNISNIVGRSFQGRGRDGNDPVVDQELARELSTALEENIQNFPQERDRFDRIFATLRSIERENRRPLNCAITDEDILDILDRADRQSLVVVIAHDPDELRTFSKRLGEASYERRRQTGRIEPPVSFIFDEADEFIPRDARGSYEDSKDIAETLARRGRKFGLGLGIATQRIRYLDTSIMAQPHTYLVSKLPRKTDREAVAEAFGMSDEMLRQTFTFQAGDWLLVSHDATGLKAVPVPISARDANQRITNYLAQMSTEQTTR